MKFERKDRKKKRKMKMKITHTTTQRTLPLTTRHRRPATPQITLLMSIIPIYRLYSV